MPLIKRGSIDRNLANRIAEINKAREIEIAKARERANEVKRVLLVNKEKRAQKELELHEKNTMNKSLNGRGMGRSIDSRKGIVNSILSERRRRFRNGEWYVGDILVAENKATQRARVQSAKDLIKARKKLRSAGWKQKPRSSI